MLRPIFPNLLRPNQCGLISPKFDWRNESVHSLDFEGKISKSYIILDDKTELSKMNIDFENVGVRAMGRAAVGPVDSPKKRQS